MRLPSSLAICVLAATTLACSSPNPDFCCVTAETCAAAGLASDDLRPCDVGQACRSYECVAAECASSADCTSAGAPACVHGLCLAGCAADLDCTGVAGRPRCDATDATCVGCTASDQCPADAAICDAEARACRGCTADDECASGVCIEATGRCAADDEILYVSQSGTDAGTCPKTFPCKTISFALAQANLVRNIIRVMDAIFHLGSSVIYLDNYISIDGSNTLLTSSATPAIHVFGTAALSAVRLASTEITRPLLTVSSGGRLKLAQVAIELGTVDVQAGGSLETFEVRFTSSILECSQGGKLTVRASYLEESGISSYCELVMSGNRVVEPTGALPPMGFAGQVQIIESNVFLDSTANRLIIAVGGSAESTFRYNTIVNTSYSPGSEHAILCPDGANVTSNLIAYNSTRPISCASRHSLFDTAGVQEVNRGVGNRSSDVMTFFRDRQAGDFRLPPSSPAIGFGEPGLVATDLEGNGRPAPAGSMPDVGAYEAP